MDEITLTEEQKKLVTDEWNKRKENPPSLMELTQLAFGRPDLDGRSMEGKAVRKFLSEVKLKAPTSLYVAESKDLLTEEQKTFVRNNCASMKIVEMTETLFKKSGLSNLSVETRAVAREVREYRGIKAGLGKVIDNPDEVPKDKWKPPRRLEEVVVKINRFTMANLLLEKLTGKQKKDLVALIGYMNVFRFVHQINMYMKVTDRDLFESSFVRYCYDKHDLDEENVDQYIDLCTEIVKSQSLQSRKEAFNRLLEETAEGEDKKFSMGLIEAIEKLETEHNQSAIRRQKLLDSLKVKRSEKEGRDKEGTASLLNLVALWRDEEERKKIIRVAEERKEDLKKEIIHLTALDELKGKICGISENEILNG